MTMYPVAILAGGLSKRLRPITETIPKAMIEVAGKPFIDWQLELLKSKGVTKVVICIGYLCEQIQKHVGDGSRYGLEVEYSFDGEKLLGTGGAIKKALALLGETFFVMYGDSYLDVNFRDIAADFEKGKAAGLMTILKNDGLWDKSNTVFDGKKIIKYDKNDEDKNKKYIDFGLVILTKKCFDDHKEGINFDLGEVFKELIAEGSMAGHEVNNRFYEIGSMEGLKETEQFLIKKGPSLA